MVGNVDAGKSTLLGVLTHGELDNGRGFARQKLFRHKHEMESGRTSSVGNDILGFDQEGQVRGGDGDPGAEGGGILWLKEKTGTSTPPVPSCFHTGGEQTRQSRRKPGLDQNLREVLQGHHLHRPGRAREVPEDHRVRDDGTPARLLHADGEEKKREGF